MTDETQFSSSLSADLDGVHRFIAAVAQQSAEDFAQKMSDLPVTEAAIAKLESDAAIKFGRALVKEFPIPGIEIFASGLTTIFRGEFRRAIREAIPVDLMEVGGRS